MLKLIDWVIPGLGVMILILFMLSIDKQPIIQQQIDSMIAECEVALPRNQTCIIIAVPEKREQ